ncbi:endo alpha-1,4 polygalactosaminidase, partial [Streptomyces sp. NPDC059166]|uniref:endo alpha-1,4 polygalactosaminidase n=1 Tax=Streptomyces sp. NPDC059166 TaxID=3346752 RepID=UPI0036B7ADC3
TAQRSRNPPDTAALNGTVGGNRRPSGRRGCQVNAFQTQPGTLRWWQNTHPGLLLRDAGGRTVIDEGWDEVLLDTSTPRKRAELADVVGGWIDGCAESGFQAVEPDNLDSFERSEGRLTRSGNAALATVLAERAHAAGLAIGQKNTTQLLGQGAAIGFDFAVTEECARYDECGAYADTYDGRVFAVEYEGEGAGDFDDACSAWGDEVSLVQRDLAVLPEGRKGYIHRTC